MLFITNRVPNEGIETVIGRDFTFDLANNEAMTSLYYCERSQNGRIKEIGSLNLLQKVKEANYNQILLYIHGYSNLPDRIFDAVEEFQSLCDQEQQNEVLVIPLIWPCTNENSLVLSYWTDQDTADRSGDSYSRALQKFLDWSALPANNLDEDPCLKRINVLAHSMGNRVYREALLKWNETVLSDGVPMIFRNSFMVAADVVNETLEPGQKGEHICHASRNVLVYYAADDRALQTSKVANLRRVASKRLGHKGPENMNRVHSNVFALDCDGVNSDYDPRYGHTYFRSGEEPGEPGIVFDHIFKTLLTGRVEQQVEERNTFLLEESRFGRRAAPKKAVKKKAAKKKSAPKKKSKKAAKKKKKSK